MRKYLYALLCAVFVLMQASCDFSSEESEEEDVSALVDKIVLRQRVNEMNEGCPIDLGYFGVLENVLLVDNNVIMRLVVSEDAGLDFDAMRDNMDQFKNGFILSFASNSDSRMLLEEIVDAEADFTLRFIKDDAQDSIGFLLNNTELSDVLNSNEETLTPRKTIELMANNANVQCPQVIDEMTTMTKVCVEDDYLTYYYSVDETQTDMDILIDNKAVLQSFAEDALMADDPMLSKVRENCREAHVGIRYIYFGSKSKKQLKITFESSEL